MGVVGTLYRHRVMCYGGAGTVWWDEMAGGSHVWVDSFMQGAKEGSVGGGLGFTVYGCSVGTRGTMPW